MTTHTSQNYAMLHRWLVNKNKAFLATNQKVRVKDVIEDKTGRYLVEQVEKKEKYRFAGPGTTHYTLLISRML